MLGSLIGGLVSAGANIISGISERKRQENLSRTQIQRRVADAKKAGIHPLAALGATTYNPSPIQIDGSGFAQMGQAVDSALDKARTQSERQTVTDNQAKYGQLQLQNMELQNAMLAAKIALIRSGGSTPPAPGDSYHIPGQPPSGTSVPGTVVNLPHKRVGSPDGAIEPGDIPDLGFARTPTGTYAPVPSKDVKQRIEDMIVPELMWSWRNYVKPTLGIGAPPPVKLPKGSEWVYNRLTQEWEIYNKRYGRGGIRLWKPQYGR